MRFYGGTLRRLAILMLWVLYAVHLEHGYDRTRDACYFCQEL